MACASPTRHPFLRVLSAVVLHQQSHIDSPVLAASGLASTAAWGRNDILTAKAQRRDIFECGSPASNPVASLLAGYHYLRSSSTFMGLTSLRR